MKPFQGAEQVSSAIKNVEKKVTYAIRGVNRQAGKLLSAGDYSGSESLIQVAKAIQEFKIELSQLLTKWKSILHPEKTKSISKNEITPLWEYYRPILQILEELGGNAKREDIIKSIEPRVLELFKNGDMLINSNGLPKWKNMIRKAKKPMIAEGFLDGNAKGFWKITAQGRQTAEGKK